MALPSTIAKINRWYDPTYASSLTAGDGFITNITNQIGSNEPLAGFGGDGGPLTGNGIGANSLIGMRFDISEPHYMEASENFVVNSQPWELWIAMRVATGLGSQNVGIFEGVGTPNSYALLNSQGFLTFNISADETDTGGLYPNNGAMHILRFLFDDTRTKVWVDGTLNATLAPGIATFTQLRIGRAVNQYLDGDIGDICTANDELTAAEATTLLNYFQRWTVDAGDLVAETATIKQVVSETPNIVQVKSATPNITQLVAATVER